MTADELRLLESTLTFSEILQHATPVSFRELPGFVEKWKLLYRDRELLLRVLSVESTPEQERLFVVRLADAWRKGMVVDSTTYPRRVRRLLGGILAVRLDTPTRAYDVLHAMAVVEKDYPQKREHFDAWPQRLRMRFRYTPYIVPDVVVDLNAHAGHAFTQLYPPAQAMGADLHNIWLAHFVYSASTSRTRRRRRRRRRGNGHRTRNHARRR